MLLKHFQERQNSNFSVGLLISSAVWPWLMFPAIRLTVLNSSSIHVPFFNLSWISQGFTWSQDFVHLPSSAFCNSPPMTQLKSRVIHESSLTDWARTDGSFHGVHPRPGHTPPTPNITVLSNYKIKEQLWIYLAQSHSQSQFPWILAVSFQMCQVWAAHLIFKAPAHSVHSYSDTRNKQKEDSCMMTIFLKFYYVSTCHSGG